MNSSYIKNACVQNYAQNIFFIDVMHSQNGLDIMCSVFTNSNCIRYLNKINHQKSSS